MVSYLEESCASDTDYSESDPLSGNHGDKNYRLPRTNRAAAVLLILVTVLERCGYYTLTVNMPFTLSRWFRLSSTKNQGLSNCTGDPTSKNYSHLDTLQVVTLMIAFYLLCSLLSVVGGWLGDSKWGRYKTLVVSFVFYILGSISFLLLMWTMICNNNNDTSCSKMTKFCKNYAVKNDNGEIAMQWVLLTLSFFFISVGYGLCKPNIAPFGADQMRENGESHLQRFYLWFYFFTNLGAFGAYAVGFMQTQNADAILYFSSFYVSLGFSVICLILLIAGSKTGVFIKIEPYEDTFQTFFSILKEWIAGFKTAPEVIRNIGLSRLDLLKRGNGGRFGEEEVNAFADLWRVVPVMSTMAVYWTCYSQFNSYYYFQAFYLQKPENVPLSIINLMNPIIILFLVPLMKDIVYPYLARRNLELHAFTRMQIGFAMAGLSLCCASIMGAEEKERTTPEWNPVPIHYFHKEDNISSNYTTYRVRDMSIAWLSPQIILMSLSEVFAIIASMEFIYLEAPQYMKSFAMGIYFFIQTIGDTIAILLVLIVKYITSELGGPWICNNLNHGKIAYFFELLMVLMIANMICLWHYSKRFRPSYYDIRFRVQERF